MGLAGQGLRDTTRIAASDPELWVQILGANRVPVLEGLEAEGEAVVLVLWSFSEDFRMLLRLRQGLKDGRNIRDLARELRLWGPKQKLAQPALRRIGARKLMAALETCARIDQQIKGALQGNPWSLLRVLAANLAS